MPFYRAAGEKLVEARDGSFEGTTAEFFRWAERNFKKSKSTIRSYMALVTDETKFRRQPDSLRSFLSKKSGRDQSPRVRPRSWHKDAKKISNAPSVISRGSLNDGKHGWACRARRLLDGGVCIPQFDRGLVTKVDADRYDQGKGIQWRKPLRERADGHF